MGLDLVKKGFREEYTYLRRPDLEHILLERSKELSIDIKYDQQIVKINQTPDLATVSLQNGNTDEYDLVVGADGVHSGVRKNGFWSRTTIQTQLRLLHSCISI